MASEPRVADEWIRTALLASGTVTTLATGGIHNEAARPQDNPPFVVYQMMSGIDRMYNGPYRAYTDMVYLVRGVVAGASYGGASADLAEAIDDALHAASGTALAGTVYTCTREEPYRRAEEDNGMNYRHQGGLYRLLVKGS